MIKLKEIRVMNFKSFKDTGWIKLNKFNVLIGPNGSGKTNFIEFFKFLKKALVEEISPYIPYLDWWSYKNIVWKGQENLPIYCGLKFEVDGYNVLHEVVFSGAGGAFRILRETFEIKGLVKLEREGNLLRIIHDHEFVDQNADTIKRLLSGRSLNIEDILEQEITLPFDFRSLLTQSYSASYQYEENLSAIFIEYKPKTPLEKLGIIISPIIKKTNQEDFTLVETAFDVIRKDVHSYIRRFTIIRHLNIREVKSPFYPIKEELKEDCSNLMSVVYMLFEENGYKLPERIEYGIRTLFPKFRIGFERGFSGEIVLRIYEDDHVLYPPSIPDGFYKVLAILTAIELKPSILAIDEIENSLHAEALEYIIDELKNSESTVIIATHSPVVVDIVDLEDLIIVEKDEGTRLRRVEEPEKVREELEELGITPSESWLYGGKL